MTRQLSGEAAGRKHELLTHGAPSAVRSIADATVIKSGPLFVVTSHAGDIPLHNEHGYGLYYHDCRFLCGYELCVGRQPLDAVAASAARGFGATLQLTNPPLKQFGVSGDHLGVRWDRVLDLDNRMLRDHLTIRNSGDRPVAVPLSLRVDADFADVFLVRGLIEAERGVLHEPQWDGQRLILSYDGIDDVRRFTIIRLDPPPDRVDGTTAIIELRISPREEFSLDVGVAVAECRADSSRNLREDAATVRCEVSGGERVRVTDLLERLSDEWVQQRPRLETDSLIVNEAYRRSMRDLGMMTTTLHDCRFYAAGVPWFVTLYGRDSLLTALMVLPYTPEIAPETLRLLARFQGRQHDEWRDEQPGKILHELRAGELANAGLVPYTPYYGSIDATSLFLILLAKHASWSGSASLLDELDEAVALAIDWVTDVGVGPDGFIAYDSTVDGGIINQGWKDSGDAMVDAEGELARPPVAVIEAQAYAYRAAVDLSALLRRCGRASDAVRLESCAKELRRRIDENYWSEDIGMYAMALEQGGRRLDVRSSNTGHAVWAGIPSAARARGIAGQLMAPDMFSGWGVRTLSRDANAYNPVGYHLGTVWPHDNAIIAEGLRRYGHNDAALRIFEGLVSAAPHYEQYRLPELFAGFARDEFDLPVQYPVACHPQAWAAAAIPALLAACLGLEGDGAARKLHLVDPVLPRFLNWVRLEGLRLGDSSCDLRLERDGDHIECIVERAEGVTVEVRPRH